MKRMVTTTFVVLGLLAASSAFALNLSHGPIPQSAQRVHPASPTPALGCDNDIAISALYQDANDRLGNTFNFGTCSTLNTVSFWHYGFGTPGPYDYDIEIWDGTTHTFVVAKTGLVAADAANLTMEEVVDMTSIGMPLHGEMLIALNPNSCIAGGAPDGTDDCYPDLLYDNQMNKVCPVVISVNNVPPGWQDVSALQGPFLIRAVTSGCVVPTRSGSWGQLKSLYR